MSDFVYVSKTARSFFASGPAHVLVYEDRIRPGDFRFHCPWCRLIHRHSASFGTVVANWVGCTGRSPLLDMGYVLHFGGTVSYQEFPRLGASEFILLSNKLRGGSADPVKTGHAS
jgi:hypothetical protein